MESGSFVIAITLTIIAGLSTGIGSLIALLSRTTNKKFLSFALGLSAGVMIYVSFVDIVPKAIDSLNHAFDEKTSNIYVTLAFFGGMLLIALIDRLVPSVENPHELRSVESMDLAPNHKQRLMRMGLMTAVVIGIHNFPEGIATFMAAYEDPNIGIAIAGAIAIHNIPEGIAVAIPVYYATCSRKKAFRWSLLSGLSEPIGALVGYLILRPFLSPTMFGLIFGAVAGIMVFISLDELLPAAREWGKPHLAIWGLITGMAVMAASIILLA